MKKTINEQLENLYQLHWEEFSNELNKIVNNNEFKIKPSNPLLLKHAAPDYYENADLRVMIFGQENNDWEDVFYNKIDKISNIYQDFYQGFKYGYRGYFKNHFNKFLGLLEQKYPNKKISCFWNNVIKVGKAGEKGTPPEYILELEQKYFSVLKKEIEIVKPNIILFFSGHNYDKYIKHQIPDLKADNIDGFSSDELQLFKIQNVDFAFRISHPQRLHFSGKAKYEILYEKIISKITLK